jgi:anti-sigma factor RsiW
MTCREWQELLADLASGDLDAVQTRRCRAHLRRCGACGRDWADYQRVRRLARQLSEEPLPDALALRLQALILQAQVAF